MTSGEYTESVKPFSDHADYAEPVRLLSECAKLLSE